MRCVVTGVEGFLGSNLAIRLQAAGHEVIGTSRNRRGGTSLDALWVRCRVEYGDVRDGGFMWELLARTEAEWVFHLAGTSVVRIAQSHPAMAFANNVVSTVGILEACHRLPHVKAVLVASSDKAYGDHGGAPYREDMPLLPSSPYETSKACADLLAQCWARTYGMRVIVTRAANLYGPGDLNFSRLVPRSCHLAATGKPPVVHAGSEQMQREWLRVQDATAAYLLLAEKGEAGPYNLGSGEIATAKYIATAIAQSLDAPLPVVEGKAVPYGEIPEQRLDSSKLRALGWKPERTLEQGLTETAEWYASLFRPITHEEPQEAVACAS